MLLPSEWLGAKPLLSSPPPPLAKDSSPTAFDSFPPGSAPAITMAMLKDLPGEYQLRKVGQTFALSNPAHDMDITFTPDGLQVLTGGKSWGMAMTGFGTRSSVKAAQKAVLKNDDGRMVYARGDVVEWYVNSPWGMEQGFTIRKAPDESSRDGLVLELSLSGNLFPSLDKDTLELADAHGISIARYTGLQVFDVDGRSLPVHLTLAGDTLRILVDDAQARYPVTIDPWIQQAKLTASDGWQGIGLGSSVAISGDTIAVGAPGAGPSGVVYVFVRPANGWANMNQAAKLSASDKAQGDNFGGSVSISSDTIVVGAEGKDNYSGSVYVFAKPATGWANMTQTAKLTASDRVEYASFGTSTAISGGTIVVGADGADNYYGAAYVYAKPATGWVNMTQTAKLTASDRGGGDKFGVSVSISGDAIVVGAEGDDDKGDWTGSAYVFVKPVSGWADMTEAAKLTASDGTTNDNFGHSVAISGNTIVVGAEGDDNFTGSAYVYSKPATGWVYITQTAKLTASDLADNDSYDFLGQSVAISGDTIVVGAATADNYGAAYVYAKPANGWADMSETAKLTASDKAQGDNFGGAVAISGDTIVTGAPGDNISCGSAYVFIYDSPPIKTEQWGLILDNDLGSANLTLSLKQDGTITADGNWGYTYRGMKASGPFTRARVTLSGETLTITASGIATSPSAPPGYTTSPYTLRISGTAYDGLGSGTFTITFQAYGWPKVISGNWQGKRTGGGGITLVKLRPLPWLMLLLTK